LQSGSTWATVVLPGKKYRREMEVVRRPGGVSTPAEKGRRGVRGHHRQLVLRTFLLPANGVGGKKTKADKPAGGGGWWGVGVGWFGLVVVLVVVVWGVEQPGAATVGWKKDPVSFYLEAKNFMQS